MNVTLNEKLQEYTKSFVHRWGEICELGEENNFNILIILQPILGFGTKELTLEESVLLSNDSLKNKNDYYEEYQKSLIELNESCEYVYDFTNIFDNKKETIYMDLAHTGDYGNSIIAEKMYEKILPIIIEDIQK